jgi:hypothetical protein
MPTEDRFEIANESRLIEEAGRLVEGDEQVDVAVGSVIAARYRSEDANVRRVVSLRSQQNLLSALSEDS